MKHWNSLACVTFDRFRFCYQCRYSFCTFFSFFVIDGAALGKPNPVLSRLLCLDTHKFQKNSGASRKLSQQQQNVQNVAMSACALPHLNESKSNFTSYSPGIDELPTDGMLFYTAGPTPQSNGRLSGLKSSYNHSYGPITTHAIITGTNLQALPNGYANTLHQQQQQQQNLSNPGTMRSDQLFRRIGLLNYPCVGTPNCLQSTSLIDNNCLVGVGQNGSLTGSLILSNDSTSFTDATGPCGTAGGNLNTPNGGASTGGNICMSPLPGHHLTQQQHHFHHHHYQHHQNQQQNQHVTQSGRPGLDELENRGMSTPLNETRSPILNMRNSHHSTCLYRNEFINESMSTDTTNSGDQNSNALGMLQSSQLPTCMTPLVVRLPSGESGVLFCPTRSSSEGFQSETLTETRNSSILSGTIERGNRKPVIQNEIQNPMGSSDNDSNRSSDILRKRENVSNELTQLCSSIYNSLPDNSSSIASTATTTTTETVQKDLTRDTVNIHHTGYVILASSESCHPSNSHPVDQNIVFTKPVSEINGKIMCTEVLTNGRESSISKSPPTSGSFNQAS